MIILAYELCNHGSLHSYWTRHKEMNIKELLACIRDVAIGMHFIHTCLVHTPVFHIFAFMLLIIGLQHMHSVSIVHRDLKPDNMLIHRIEQSGELIGKVGDVGLCAIASGKPCGQLPCESWKAPESRLQIQQQVKHWGLS